MFRWRIRGLRRADRQTPTAPAEEPSVLSEAPGDEPEPQEPARNVETESAAAPRDEDRQSARPSAPGVMYEAFYGLKERPFTTVPDPQFLYWSEAHQLAFAILHYGVMTRAPITVVTGDIGAGKTTLIRRLLDEIPEELTVGLVSNMKEGRGELLHWVMMALGQDFQADEPYVALFKRFQDFLIEAYARGRRVVLIVDEAQNLGAAALEELRMFTNINADKDELLQLILVGQPQLRALLQQPELVQFTQRISADFHLEPLTPSETVSYIRRRLEVAGAEHEIFSEELCERICAATGGVPRLINILCDMCMVYGFAENRAVLDSDILDEILASTQRRGIFGQFGAKGEVQPRRVVRGG